MFMDVLDYAGLYRINKSGKIVKISNNTTMTSVSNGTGYLQTGLTKNKKRVRHYTHILVWTTFNGTVPEGYEIGHKNNKRDDPCLKNLELTTRKDNMAKMLKLQRKKKQQNKE